mmetsp:Transcript_18769/g.21577  ORF Transcript_18769/g.21577 Transcript_18769/m.21577 type:complete len:116 (-) Transcript_18769:25-372(-)
MFVSVKKYKSGLRSLKKSKLRMVKQFTSICDVKLIQKTKDIYDCICRFISKFPKDKIYVAIWNFWDIIIPISIVPYVTKLSDQTWKMQNFELKRNSEEDKQSISWNLLEILAGFE